MSRFPSPQVSLRDANKIATTNMHNELAAAILAQQPPFITGHHRPARAVPFLFWASIATQGPTSQDKDYTDSRYWVQPLYLPGGPTYGPNDKIGGLGLQGPLPDATLLGVSAVTASNQAEISYGVNQVGVDTHLLLKGQVVHVTAWVDVGSAPDSQHKNGSPPNVHYVFDKAPPYVLPVFLASDGGTDPNWTYTLTYRGVVLNTHQSPTVGPPRITTSVSQANFGYAHIDPAGSGKYVLGLCNEVPATNTCS